ncbi:Oidioi.mRNA.OKI2018_I69.PAR.g11827.t1.cds [Oikopleura dioica]|uniref:Oidioi.mRNA.OKI2018_I69.PAR.g11827.t1.cds n=1 Tax=Oikopleura dioica TaxID=34765 RepID=A0ABN7RXM6_OIKDI|nr:Oidioi.mRNA.OKI2018_I69.PAR.g11827.t1.cds [Oikopleura dioica]
MSNLLTDDEDLHIHIHGEKSVRIEFLEEGDFEGSGDIEEDERRIKASTAWLVIGAAALLLLGIIAIIALRTRSQHNKNKREREEIQYSKGATYIDPNI